MELSKVTGIEVTMKENCAGLGIETFGLVTYSVRKILCQSLNLKSQFPSLFITAVNMKVFAYNPALPRLPSAHLIRQVYLLLFVTLRYMYRSTSIGPLGPAEEVNYKVKGCENMFSLRGCVKRSLATRVIRRIS